MPPRWLKFLPPILQRQLASPMAQKLVGNTGWLFADKLLKAVGELTVGIWLARYLGPDQFGTLSFAIAFVALFTPLYKLGLHKPVVRDIVQSPEQKEVILGSAFGLRLISGIASLAAAILIIKSIQPNNLTLQTLVIVIASGSIFQASDVITFWFESQIAVKPDVLARGSAYVISSLTRISFILSNATVIFFGVTHILESVVAAIFSGFAYYKTQNKLRSWRFEYKKACTLFLESWPLILSGLALVIYMRIDQVMLGQLVGSDAVGIYSIAIKLSEGWYFIPVAISISAFPAIVASKENDEGIYYHRLNRLFRITTLISYAAIVILLLFSETLVKALLGEEYLTAVLIMKVNAFSGIFISAGVIRSLWMASENLLHLYFFSTALGAVVNVTLNYFMIIKFNILGASMATLLSYSLANYFSGFLFRPTRKVALIMTNSFFLKK